MPNEIHILKAFERIAAKNIVTNPDKTISVFITPKFINQAFFDQLKLSICESKAELKQFIVAPNRKETDKLFVKLDFQ